MPEVPQNWSDLRVFLAVMRAGSTLGASRSLSMAQPTVARRIEALEHQLNLTLFLRDTRGFKPTSAAQSLMQKAENVEEAACAFFETAQRLSASAARVIRITAVEAAFGDRLSAVLQEFTAHYGDIRFEFLATNGYVDISAGEADVAIRLTNTIDDPNLICRYITEIKGALFASPGYAERAGLPDSPAEFGGHKFIVYKGKNIPKAANDWVLSQIDPGQIAMSCTDVKSMGMAIHIGAGIGFLPVRSVPEDAGLVRLFELPPETSSKCWLLANPTAYRRKEVKAFTAFFAPRYSALFEK